MFFRALGLASGAQASSRSRKTWSAGRPLALSRKRGLLPGTARLERRDRSPAMRTRLLRREAAEGVRRCSASRNTFGGPVEPVPQCHPTTDEVYVDEPLPLRGHDDSQSEAVPPEDSHGGDGSGA